MNKRVKNSLCALAVSPIRGVANQTLCFHFQHSNFLNFSEEVGMNEGVNKDHLRHANPH